MWQQWINLVLGIWIALSPYLNLSESALATNFTIAGLAVAVLAVWGALQHQNQMTMGRDREHFHSRA